jgi:hypothetical protein
MAGSHKPENEMLGIRTDKDGYGQPPLKGPMLFVTDLQILARLRR